MTKTQSDTKAQTSIVIASPLGLHARPAAKLVKLAQKFPCTITLQMGEASADAQSILDILTLSASHGSTVTIQCEGDGAFQACEQIAHFLENEIEEQPNG